MKAALVSFEVKNLFLPKTHAKVIQYVRQVLRETQQLCIEVESTLMVTELCIQANTFQYDGKLYRQVKGVLMGSPASFVLAELIMQSIEKPTLSETEIII